MAKEDLEDKFIPTPKALNRYFESGNGRPLFWDWPMFKDGKWVMDSIRIKVNRKWPKVKMPIDWKDRKEK